MSMVTLTLHSVRWRVDLRIDPPTILRWDPQCGWYRWVAGRDPRRILFREKLLERAKALDL